MASTMTKSLTMLSRRSILSYSSISSSRVLPALSQSHHHIIQPSPASRTSIRHSSHSPMGHPPVNVRPKVTIHTLMSMYKKKEPITMLTAYDFPSAHVADHAGMDMVLVGDSLAMVALGLEDTSEVTMDEMIMCSRAVSRAVRAAFTVGDLPMGSYEVSPQQAVASAVRLVKEGRVQSVKLEGGAAMAPTVKAIVNAGIPVLGHVGLTPQRQHALGGFRVQGKTAAAAEALLDDALAIQEAGAYGIVLEAVPPRVAAMISERLRIPTIGIGAGNGTSGQVLVQVDMLSNSPPGRHLPKFVKRYGDLWGEAMKGIEQYRDEVKARTFPAEEHCYKENEAEVAKFEEILKQRDVEKKI